MNTIGIIAALPGELKPLVRGWEPLAGTRAGMAAYRGRVASRACVAVAAGMGRDAATTACALAVDHGPCAALVSIGWAGAISCGVKPGEAYAVAEVVDANTGERFPTSFRNNEGGRVKVVSLDHVARGAEKRRVAEAYLAVLVDMEAATVGRIARARGVPFYCFKGVSDGATEKMPDFNSFIQNGNLRAGSLAMHSAIRPQYWGPLVRMGKNSSRSAAGLAQMLTAFLSDENNLMDGDGNNDGK
jgi:adenosylhomocysteine nucleosidase